MKSAVEFEESEVTVKFEAELHTGKLAIDIPNRSAE